MIAFPNASEAVLVPFDEAEPMLPIVGWMVIGAGPNVLPLVVGRNGPLVTGDAIQTPSGKILDLVTTRIYDDADLWRADVTENEYYRPGMTSPLLAFGSSHRVSEIPPDLLHERNAVVPPAPTGLFTWSSKSFKTASFWHCTDAQPPFVFTVEKGDIIPASGATKITRDEFYALRKTIPQMTVKPGDDQPELPLSPEPDDADDLI